MARTPKRRSFYPVGGTGAGDANAWTPRVDKNPFYRTMDIFNGVFKKNIKLAAGKFNATDGKTIFVDFGELKPSRIASVVRDGKSQDYNVYELECGHEWEGRKTDKDGNVKAPGRDWGMCGVCGADQIYRGFEHEWQHIIFKSDLGARKLFCDQYADQLLKQAPDVDREELIGFLAFLTNVFDDIRVNSLWEKVYPGSAAAIWDRWRFYTHKMGDEVNKSFIPFIFAVSFGLPTDPQSEFEPMRPIVEWAVQKVKYRGFANMLIDIRVLLDRCMGALLADLKPPPPKGLRPPPPPPTTVPPSPQLQGASSEEEAEKEKPEEDAQRSGQESQRDASSQPGNENQGSSDEQGIAAGNGHSSGAEAPNTQQAGASSGQGSTGSEVPNAPDVRGIPSASTLKAEPQKRNDALKRLMQGVQELDPKEEHPEPSDEDVASTAMSQAARAMLAKALNIDVSDLDALEAKLPTGEVDDDMQKQIDQLQLAASPKSEASLLTSNAKAKITIINVTRDGIPTDGPIELDEEERMYVNRMRAAFFRSLGRQKSKRGPTGNQVDVQALIQYRGDHQDPNVFENEEVNRGFAYSVLCDMSGSMNGTFPIVCHAVEMLKQALSFPFVEGTLWGFRGGQALPGQGYRDASGEVWMYHYAKDVNWYKGMAKLKTNNRMGTVQVPVECGGITPMNAAVNVAATHLWKKMPTGMAKRLFLLTDGSPVHTKISGGQIPEFMLRQFVAKEVRDARKHGVQVYTIVIGQDAIDEDKCLQMFGPRQFWRRVSHRGVGSALANIVLANFSKYIRTKG